MHVLRKRAGKNVSDMKRDIKNGLRMYEKCNVLNLNERYQRN